MQYHNRELEPLFAELEPLLIEFEPLFELFEPEVAQNAFTLTTADCRRGGAQERSVGRVPLASPSS